MGIGLHELKTIGLHDCNRRRLNLKINRDRVQVPGYRLKVAGYKLQGTGYSVKGIGDRPARRSNYECTRCRIQTPEGSDYE
jgi:hypothetical protein